MSQGIVPGNINQATPTDEVGSSPWAIPFLAFLVSALSGSSNRSDNIISDNPGGCRKRSIAKFLEPIRPYDGLVLDAGLRPSLVTPQQLVVECANGLSLLGSIAIILHIPRVIKQTPAQKTRMLIVLFTAISNTGFALANVVTDLTAATAYIPCSISAWCYIFFQLLTCLLVIVSTFRLCGVFLFKQQKAFPTKAVIFCPAVAFILATSPAIAGAYAFDTCGHYCWFKLEGDIVDCRVRSLWAWFCFYIPMIVLLAILFGSTSFVMIKIALAVMHSRSDLKNVANASLGDSALGCASDVGMSSKSHSVSTFERLRSMSQAFQSRTSSVFSFRSARLDAHSKLETTAQATTALKEVSSNSSSDTTQMGDIRIQVSESDLEPPMTLSVPTAAHISRMSSLGQDSLTSRNEGILASSSDPRPSVRIDDFETDDGPANLETIRSRSPLPVPSSGNGGGRTAILRAKERPFYLAILRQALYPISISVSGCIQTIVDLTLDNSSTYADAFDYAANVGTSIQGFLFFLVFLFDPAVVQTRQAYRKYLIWKYYVEFYYSLGMPQEGRAFEDQFLQKCRDNLRQDKNITQFDQLTRPPAYSWSIQYDDLAMPCDFQTSFPLFHGHVSAGATIATTSAARKNRNSTGRESQSGSPSMNGPRISNRSPSPVKPPGLPSTILEVEESVTPSSRTSMDLNRSSLHPHSRPTDFMSRPSITATDARTDYTPNLPSIPHPLSTQANSIPTSVSASSSTVSFSDPIAHSTTMYCPPTPPPPPLLATETGVETTATATESNPVEGTILTPTSPDSPYSVLESGGSSTWPKSSHLQPRISTDGDDFQFGSEVTGNSGRVSLRAPFAGDVLSFPRLSRVTTIGGSDMRSATSRGHRSSSVALAASRRRTLQGRGSSSNSKSSSIANIFRWPGGGSPSLCIPAFNCHNNQSGGENPLRLQPERSMSAQDRYQCHFQWPRLAYLMHKIVRLVYIPRRVRLPPIPSPFSNSRIPYLVDEMITPTQSIQPQSPRRDMDLWSDPDPDLDAEPEPGQRCPRHVSFSEGAYER